MRLQLMGETTLRDAFLGAAVIAAAFALTTPSAGAARTADDIVATTASRVSGLVDRGAAPPTLPVGIAVTLRYRNAEALERLVTLQNDETSPIFRHWLSNAQFDAEFGPTSAQYARVATVLAAGGFRVTGTSANRTVIDATGDVASVERLFGTSIHLFDQHGNGHGFANVVPAHVPAQLRGIMLAVSGLSSLKLVKSDIALTSPATHLLGSGEPIGPPLRGPVSSVTGVSGFGPLAFSRGYNFPVRHAMVVGGQKIPLDGRGRISGIAIDADFLNSDLRAFLKYFGVVRTAKQPTRRIAVDGGPPPGLASPDSVEASLDVEALVSNAPGTALYVYEFPDFNNLSYVTDTYNRVVSDDVVDTLNSSFGGCEDAFESDALAWNAIALQGAAKGITFHASCGDYGADACFGGTNSVAAPASSPHFVAIGGTSLFVSPSGQYGSETVWNTVDVYATGGGVSDVFPLPAWQLGTPNIISTGRNMPDVSFDANPDTGMALYYDGSWDTKYDPVGGTSLASPLFGAAQTEIDQFIGTRAGLASARQYKFFRDHGYNDRDGEPFFHAIHSGCNTTDSPGFCANGSYSQATGIGSMDVSHFMRATVEPDGRELR